MFIFLSLCMWGLVRALCPKELTFACPDKIGFFCCARNIGDTACTCSDDGWDYNGSRDFTGCPENHYRDCGYAISSFNDCCPESTFTCDASENSSDCKYD